jgi:hypothetical protein
MLFCKSRLGFARETSSSSDKGEAEKKGTVLHINIILIKNNRIIFPNYLKNSQFLILTPPVF